MKRFTRWVACVGILAGCANAEPPLPVPRPSGIDVSSFDERVRAQDDFYQHVNGKWLASAEIPADKSSYGTFDELHDRVLEQLRTIVEDLQHAAGPTDPEQQKIADLYSSFMDEGALEAAGLAPLAAEFAGIAALKHKAQFPALIAHLNQIGASAPYSPQVHQDARDPTRYVFDLGQDGLGMPDRDYYLDNDPKLMQIRAQYRRHVERMLALAGDASAAADAKAVVALETVLARGQWTPVQNRDPVKTYNKVAVAQLPALAAGYDWNAYLAAAGVQGKTDYLIISQPSYITALGEALRARPLAAWKAYLRWRLLAAFAPYLSKPFVEENFAFYGTVLRGVPQDMPRWKRALRLVDRSIGEGLGKLYVAKHFPPEARARMDRLVGNLLAAYRADLATLDWMGPDTRRRALDKLAKFTTKIGYPAAFRDYGALRIATGDLVGNVMRARTFEYQRNLSKLGRPVDRSEWDMTPQTINAYYNPEWNEIVFPAAILQPPFFNAAADDAVNYGSIGAIIGHEISHGFDDEGSQYDGDGRLLTPPGWFTAADLDAFKARTRALVAQYAAYAPVPGYPINGELTLGENIADNSGLAIAYKAYRISLGGEAAPMLDGLTGDQRFFIGYARAWREKMRDNEAIRLIKIDPHAPSKFRGQLPEMNLAPFDAAFGVEAGDRMYLPPDKRVSLW
jgi:putative endopeptidase